MKTWWARRCDISDSFISLYQLKIGGPIYQEDKSYHLIPAASWAKLMEFIKEYNDPSLELDGHDFAYRIISTLNEIDGEEDGSKD